MLAMSSTQCLHSVNRLAAPTQQHSSVRGSTSAHVHVGRIAAGLRQRHSQYRELIDSGCNSSRSAPALSLVTRAVAATEEAVSTSNITTDVPSIFVGGLSGDVKIEDLTAHFTTANTGYVPTQGNAPNSPSKGWGILEFASVEAANEAIQKYDNTEFKGRTIILRPDKNRAATNWRLGRTSPNLADRVVGNRVYVAGLSMSTSWASLKSHFESAGTVVGAHIKQNLKANKAAAVVEFANSDDARKAIADLFDTNLDGNVIKVREDKDEIYGKKGGKVFGRNYVSPFTGGAGNVNLNSGAKARSS